MQITDTFRPRSDNVASEDFDGEFVVLDLETGKYFSLAGGSAIVWRGLMSGHSVETLTAGLSAADARRTEITALVGQLVDHQLLVAAGTPAAGTPETAAELAASAGPFTIKSFEDLADLIMTDPIHDVDEGAGWPHRPSGEGRE